MCSYRLVHKDAIALEQQHLKQPTIPLPERLEHLFLKTLLEEVAKPPAN